MDFIGRGGAMLEYNIHLKWQRRTEDFNYDTYDRKHTVFFYGGPKIQMDAAPHLVRNPNFQTPEELLTAALSSCFMLTFLSLSSLENRIINVYHDDATCLLNQDNAKVVEIILRPTIVFEQGHKPSKTTLKELIAETRKHCFIANSLATEITVNPIIS